MSVVRGSKPPKPPLPVDINLPERVMLDGGTLFVVLPTLDELEVFWNEHKEQFQFACEGKHCERPIYLRPYEWVFGSSKAAVVRTVMRFGQSGVGCEFHDWAQSDPGMHTAFFRERDEYRESQMDRGFWSDEDEASYRMDSIRRTPKTYRGWWQFKDLPGGFNPLDWFNPTIHHEELFDPSMPIAAVESKLLEQTFDDWKASDVYEIEYHDQVSIEETIAYWRGEQADQQGYYGDENEVAAP